MTEIEKMPKATPLWETQLFKRAESGLWFVYVLLPLFTGWIAYHWLPNERSNDERHELIETYDSEDSHGNTYEVPAVWKDKETGEEYFKSEFSSHKNLEAVRIGALTFAYGLLGCVFFSGMQSLRKQESFGTAFRMATKVNLGIAVLLVFQVMS
jgi:hypothetical protein